MNSLWLQHHIPVCFVFTCLTRNWPRECFEGSLHLVICYWQAVTLLINSTLKGQGVLQNRGVCLEAFPCSPLPLLPFFARTPAFENRKSYRNACYAGYNLFYRDLFYKTSFSFFHVKLKNLKMQDTLCFVSRRQQNQMKKKMMLMECNGIIITFYIHHGYFLISC